MPATRGWATRSSASRPSRRRTKAPRLSSGSRPRGSTRSRAMRSLPGQEKRRERSKGPKRVGARSWKPSGSGCRRPRKTTKTRRKRSSVRTSLSSRPIRRQSSSAQGFSERNESAPHSTRKPSRRSVWMVPPSRSEASKRLSSRSSPPSRASSQARWAAARPAMPPPTMASFTRERPSCRSLPDEVGQHGDEEGMIIGGGGAVEAKAELVGDLARLDVEIVEDLDVIAHEADGGQDHVADALALEPAQHVADVGLEPGLARGAAPALIGNLPALVPESRGDRARGALELVRIGRFLRHGRGHAVSGEDQEGVASRLQGNPAQGVAHARRHRVEEARVIPPPRREGHLGSARADLRARVIHVPHVARPRGLGLEGRENDAEGTAMAGLPHPRQGLPEEGMPVPHPDVDGKRGALARESLAKRLGLTQRQLGQGRSPADHLVVMGDGVETLGRDAATGRDDLEKRPDVLRLLRPAERQEEHRVDDHRADSSWTMSTSAFTFSTGVSWWTPCPRLKMWPGRPWAPSRMPCVARRMAPALDRSTAGSRLPCTAMSWPSRSQVGPSSTRQSSPRTSPPASLIKGRRPAVPTPK